MLPQLGNDLHLLVGVVLPGRDTRAKAWGGCGFEGGDAAFQGRQPVIHSFFHIVDST
jgi:hypothetical protein